MTLAFDHRQPKVSHIGEVHLEGSFKFNGASAPTTIRANWIDSIAHTATGKWTITMKEQYRGWQGLLSGQATLQINADGDLSFAQLGDFDASNGTLVVRVFTEASGTLAAADVAAGSGNGNWGHVSLKLKESTAVDGSGF